MNSDLGFSDASRHESIRRAGEVAKLLVNAGIIVIASFISPFRVDRDAVRALFADGQFFEVHVDAPLHVVESRDTKGLYRKAREGSLRNFTGIDSPFEPPLHPELRLSTAEISPRDALQQVLKLVEIAVLPTGVGCNLERSGVRVNDLCPGRMNSLLSAQFRKTRFQKTTMVRFLDFFWLNARIVSACMRQFVPKPFGVSGV
ncbi:hypothetical protein QFZ99_006617 [Paraburkholderia atlantica]|uniref:adenylyl-sulfate kinase n=1 Tax=Paraburkholderia atlantica TaxID=2654982 RepID=UPI003D1C71FF